MTILNFTCTFAKLIWAKVFAHYNELFKDGFDERKLVLSRDFIKNGCLVMLDALSEFNHRRRAQSGEDAIVQRDVDLLTSIRVLIKS